METFGIMDAPQETSQPAYGNLTDFIGIGIPVVGGIPTYDGCNWSYTLYNGYTCADVQNCITCAFLDSLLLSSDNSLTISGCDITINPVGLNQLVNLAFLAPNLTVGDEVLNLTPLLDGFYFNVSSTPYGKTQTIKNKSFVYAKALDGLRSIVSGTSLSIGLPQDGPFLPDAPYYPYHYVLTWVDECAPNGCPILGARWRLDPCCEQTLSVSGDTMCITGAGCSGPACTTGGNGSCINMDIFDNQQLSLLGNILSLENSGDVDLSNINNHHLELNCFVLQLFNGQDMLLSNVLLPHRKHSYSDCEFCETLFPIWDCCDVIRAMAPTINQLYFQLGELWKRTGGQVPVHTEEYCDCDGPRCSSQIRRGSTISSTTILDGGTVTNYVNNQSQVTTIINNYSNTSPSTIIGYSCCTDILDFNVIDRLECQEFHGMRWVQGRTGDPFFGRGLPCIPIASKAVTGMVDDPDNVSWYGTEDTVGGCSQFPDMIESWVDNDRGFKGFLPTNDPNGPYSINGPYCIKGPNGSLRVPEDKYYHVYMNMQFHVNYLVHAFRAVLYVEDPLDPTVRKVLIDKKYGGDVGTASRSLNNGYYKEEKEWPVVGSVDVALKKGWLIKFAIKIDANVCWPICSYSTTPNETTPGSGVIDWTAHTRDYALGFGPGTNNSALPVFNGEGCATPTFNGVGNGQGSITIASTALTANTNCDIAVCNTTISPNPHTHSATLTSLILPTIPPHAPYYWNGNSDGTSNLRYPGNFLTIDFGGVPQWESFTSGLGENPTLFPSGSPLITIFNFGQKKGVPCDDTVTDFDGWTGSVFGFHSIKCVQDTEIY